MVLAVVRAWRLGARTGAQAPPAKKGATFRTQDGERPETIRANVEANGKIPGADASIRGTGPAFAVGFGGLLSASESKNTRGPLPAAGAVLQFRRAAYP